MVIVVRLFYDAGNHPIHTGEKTTADKTFKKKQAQTEKGGNVMNELIKSYIGKEIIVWTNWSSGVSGTATRIEENWLEIQDKKGNLKLLNTDYISRIQEYPKNKNGQKKAIVM